MLCWLQTRRGISLRERGRAANSRVRFCPYAFYLYAVRGVYLSTEFLQGTTASLRLATEFALQTRGDKGYRRTPLIYLLRRIF